MKIWKLYESNNPINHQNKNDIITFNNYYFQLETPEWQPEKHLNYGGQAINQDILTTSKKNWIEVGTATFPFQTLSILTGLLSYSGEYAGVEEYKNGFMLMNEDYFKFICITDEKFKEPKRSKMIFLTNVFFPPAIIIRRMYSIFKMASNITKKDDTKYIGYDSNSKVFSRYHSHTFESNCLVFNGDKFSIFKEIEPNIYNFKCKGNHENYDEVLDKINDITPWYLQYYGPNSFEECLKYNKSKVKKIEKQ